MTSISANYVSLAIFAWNEEEAIASTLESLFQQSLFEELEARGLRCEVICVVNGCTDRTPEVAAEIFEKQAREHPNRKAFSGRVANLAERGKVNAWNQFVHKLSDEHSRFLFMMDADILIHRRQTVWNMLSALQKDAQANVAVDVPCKDIGFKSRKSLIERLSVNTSRVTLASQAQLCGQLYCIRAEVARNIYLPKDLAACEDGFIKTLVCTDFLTRPVSPERICVAPDAEHTFEAYTSIPAILRNQRRQIMGQTIVHILADKHLNELPLPKRLRLAESLRGQEATDPLWLKKLIAEHLRQVRFFWRLYPGLLTQRFKMLARLDWQQRMRLFPAALAACLITLFPSLLAYRALKRGSTDYWPKARRAGLTHPKHSTDSNDSNLCMAPFHKKLAE